MMFKEVYPQYESCGLDSLVGVFQGTNEKRHRAMGDAMALAQCYPKLKALYFQKYNWQLSQIDHVEYLFERYLRLQSAINTMQSEIQDLRSIFKIYFERGGKEIQSNTGEILTYNHKKTFSYDFSQINNSFVDRLVAGNSVSQEVKDKIKSARIEISENKSFGVIKPEKKNI